MKQTIFAVLLLLTAFVKTSIAQSSMNATAVKENVITKAYLGAEFSYPGTGAVITNITPYSPAELNYLRVGDIINTIGNNTINSAADMETAMNNYKPDEIVTIGFTRKGKAKTKKVRLDKIRIISEQ